MKQYKELIQDILENGEVTEERTGVGTYSLFGTQLRFDLTNGFPAVTTKKLAWKSVVSELLWFMSGSTNVNDLRYILHRSRTEGKTIWDENYNNQGKALGYAYGELGPVYGSQWRNFGGVDQLKDVIKNVKSDVISGTSGRRHIVSAWNPIDLDKMTLPPCHMSFQIKVHNDKGISISWYQRSVDAFLGLPFNIASYALLTHIIAKLVGGYPKTLIFTGGDTHVYRNHLNQCEELLAREPLDLPTLELPDFDSLNEVLRCDLKGFVLKNYKHHSTITAPMAV